MTMTTKRIFAGLLSLLLAPFAAALVWLGALSACGVIMTVFGGMFVLFGMGDWFFAFGEKYLNFDFSETTGQVVFGVALVLALPMIYSSLMDKWTGKNPGR